MNNFILSLDIDKLKKVFKKVFCALLITLFLWLFKLCVVNAAVGDSSFYINNSKLTNNNYVGVSSGNFNFNVNYLGYPDNLYSPTTPWFVSIVLCADNVGTSIYSNNTAVSDISLIKSRYKCYYPDSGYNGGFIYFLNYKNSGGGSYNNSTFTIYNNSYSSITLIDFKISLDSWVNQQDYSSISNIFAQQEIINSNLNINNKLDNIIDSDISDKDKELPDKSKYDDYNKAQGSLTDKVKQADLSNINVGIDKNASSFVWDTLTSFLKANSLIFSCFIAILSIGIIKLALGR